MPPTDEINAIDSSTIESKSLWIGRRRYGPELRRRSGRRWPASRGNAFGDVYPDDLQEIYGQRPGLQPGAKRNVTPQDCGAIAAILGLQQVDQGAGIPAAPTSGIRPKS